MVFNLFYDENDVIFFNRFRFYYNPNSNEVGMILLD